MVQWGVFIVIWIPEYGYRRRVSLLVCFKHRMGLEWRSGGLLAGVAGWLIGLTGLFQARKKEKENEKEK